MADNIFVRLAKLLVKSQFKKVLDQIGKEVDSDPNLQAKLPDIKQRTLDLQDNLEHFCKHQPWHILCKDKKGK